MQFGLGSTHPASSADSRARSDADKKSRDTDLKTGFTSEQIFAFKCSVNVLKEFNDLQYPSTFLTHLAECKEFDDCTWTDEFFELYKAYKEEYKSVKFTSEEIIHFTDIIQKEITQIDDPFKVSFQTTLFGDLLELTHNERLVLELTRLLTKFYECPLRHAFETLRWENTDKVKFYSMTLGLSRSAIKETFNGFMFKSQMLIENIEFKNSFQINGTLEDLMFDENLSLEVVDKTLFPETINSDLDINNFKHLDEQITQCTNILNNGINTDAKGLNVLFWGIPGTGKTELAVTLAKKHGWNIKVVGQSSIEQSRIERITNLQIALHLFKNTKNTVILFDEMEDLFKTDTHAEFSKAFINRVLSTADIPIIWTTNEIVCCGQAVLRRMIYSIEFKIPKTSTRLSIWQNYLEKNEIILDENMVETLATDYPIAPSLIANAVKIIKLGNVQEVDIPPVLQNIATLMQFGKPFKPKLEPKKDISYKIEYLNADLDMVKLTDKLLLAKPNFSLCMYGPSGTGKSEYLRHLAHRMQKKVSFKRASDLESMWVGETEKNIAKAFEEAKEDELFLIIDEADSFFRSRESASQSWEVTKVNEILSQMELHDQPFGITTNLFDILDAAALRRFTFKIKVDFLKPEMAAKMYQDWFGFTPPDEIYKEELLTPGDFYTVSKKTKILNCVEEEYWPMLLDEVKAKPQFKNPMGFK